MRVWHLSGGELELNEVGESSPQVGEILRGKPVTRVWPDGDPFHRWRLLFEAGCLKASNLEECAREAGLWDPSERVLGYLKAMGFEVQHIAGQSPAHQMVFAVRNHDATPDAPWGMGVVPLLALVDFADLHALAPPAQAEGTVVPMPALMQRADGTLAGPGIAISKRLEEFMAEPHNRMLPKDWVACLLNWAAYYAQTGGCDAEQFQELASKTYARVFEDRKR